MHDEAMRQVLSGHQGKFFGKYRGLVNDNMDLLGRGRLEVIVPQVLGDTPVWALPCAPYAGKGIGFYALPPKDTVVWVEFEAGDPNYPIWTGFLWPPNDIPLAGFKPNEFFKTDSFAIEINENLPMPELTIKSLQGDAMIKITPMEITMKAPMVTVEGAGGRKVALTGVSVSINNGGLDVM